MPPKKEKIEGSTRKVKLSEEKERIKEEKERLKAETKKIKEEAKMLKEKEKKDKEEAKMLKEQDKKKKDEELLEKKKAEDIEREKIINEHKKKQSNKSLYKPFLKVLKEDGDSIKKIIHIGDIHIRLAERHNEYNKVFDQFYKELNIIKKSEPNTIVCLCGDLLEKKDNLKPDTVIHTWNFLKNVSDIFPLIIIAGNHDVIETNYDKNDSISAILKDRPWSNIFYLKNSGIYIYSNLIFSVSSIIDKHILVKSEFDSILEDHKSNINIYENYELDMIKNICLYHGPLIDAMTNLNHIIKNEEEMIVKYMKLSDFGNYDYYLLGDIHKFQYLNQEKTAAYCSSMISQNFTETDDEHGYLEWNILDKTSNYHILLNEHRHYKMDIRDIIESEETMLIDDKKLIEKLSNIKSGNMEIRYMGTDYLFDLCGLQKKIMTIRPNLTLKPKVISNSNIKKRIQLNKIKTKQIIQNQITKLFDNPITKSSDSDTNNEILQNNLIQIDGCIELDELVNINSDEKNNNDKKIDMNISDEYVLKLVDMYLNENYGEMSEEMKKMIKEKLNEKIKRVENSSEYSEYDWRILYLEFENMYGYGYNNVFDFTKYANNNIIGIFGQNGLGKSAFIDIITFMLYCRSARSKSIIIPKDIINVSSVTSHGNLIIESGGKKYLISRYCRRENTKNNAVKVETSLFELRLVDESIEIPKQNTMNYMGKKYQKYCLTEEHRKYTDKVIEKIVGSYDSFLMTSILLQGNAKTFKEMDRADKKKRLYEILKIDHFENANDEITEQRKILRKQLKEKETVFNTTNFNMEQLKINIEQLKTQTIPDLYSNAENAQSELNKLSDEINIFVDQLKPLNKSLNLITSYEELDEFKIKRLFLQDNIEDIKSKIDTFKSRIQSNNKKINSLKYLKQVDLITDAYNEYHENLKLKQKSILDEIKLLNQTKQSLNLIKTKYEKIEDVENELELLNDQINELSDEKMEFELLVKKYQKQLKQLKMIYRKDEITQANTDYKNQLKTQLNDLIERIDGLKQSKYKLRSNLKQSDQSNDELNTELIELNEQKSSIESYLGSENVVKYLKSENKITSDYENLMKSSTDYVYNKLNELKSLKTIKESFKSDIDEIIDTLNMIFNKPVKTKHSTILKYEQLEIFKKKYNDQISELEDIKNQISEINDKIKLNLDNEQIQIQIAKIDKQLSKLESKHNELSNDIPNLPDYDELQSELETKSEIDKKLADLGIQIEKKEIENQKINNQIKSLEDEKSYIESNEKTKLKINSLNKKLQLKQTELDNLDDENNQIYIDYNELKKEKQLNEEISKSNIQSEQQIIKEQQMIHNMEIEIKQLNEDIANYETNRETIMANNQIQSQIEEKKSLSKDFYQNIKIINDEIIKSETELNKLENKKSEYETKNAELLRLKTETKIAEYLHEITGPNGIALYILKNRLGDFTKMINTILKPFIDKHIELEIVSDGVDMIIHTIDDHIIYTIGGMESLMLDFTFKIIVGYLSIMPKCNLLFIDESISVLDKERLDHIDDIFAFLKQYYSNVFLITHIEDVKYKMDDQITIYRINDRTIIHNTDNVYYIKLTEDTENKIEIEDIIKTSKAKKSIKRAIK